MNNENIIAFPASTTFTPEQALHSVLEFARNDNLTDVLIAGYDGSGDLIVRSSRMTKPDALFILEKLRMWVLHERTN